MTNPTFNSLWSCNNCRVLRLENDLLRVDVLPDCGGKILHLVHKPAGRDYLWQHPSIPPAILPNACNYDDNFCGGWDDCFPSIAPCVHNGEVYPDHGEYWTRRFDWQIDRTGDSLTLYLQATGGMTPTRMEKWLTLTAGSTALKLRHRVTHLGDHPFEFQWSQHPAVAISPNHEFVIPAGSGSIGSTGMSRLANAPAEFTWPHVPGRDGTLIDYRKMPARVERPGFEMLYLRDVNAGWYAILDRSSHCGFGLSFDRSVFKHLWLFASYGGWRGLRLAIVEPCTSWPCELPAASAAGRCTPLQPGQIIDTHSTAVIFTGRDTITDISPQGDIR